MLASAQGLWEIKHRIKFGPQNVAKGTHSASLIRDLQSELSRSEGTPAGGLAIPLVHTSLGKAGMLSLRGAWAVLHVKKLLCSLLCADGEVHDLRCLVLWVGGGGGGGVVVLKLHAGSPRPLGSTCFSPARLTVTTQFLAGITPDPGRVGCWEADWSLVTSSGFLRGDWLAR